MTQIDVESPRDERWAAVTARDSSADGGFVYAVSTTGVYCRPSCAARTPRREHVAFFDSPAAARRAGFRACRRCRPDEPPLVERRAEVVADLCHHIDGSEAPPTVAALARRAGWSVSHLHRVFREVTGVTPKAYIAGRRADRLRDGLQQAQSVTEAAYGAGYGSSSRLYEGAGDLLGMSPGAWRRGGAGETIRVAVGQTTLGAVLVAATERGLCAVALGDDAETLLQDLQQRFEAAELVGGDAAFDALVAHVCGAIELPASAGPASLPLDVRGTVFQRRVWQALREVPAGETRSYSEVAKAIGAPKSVRAVASVCGQNPVAVVIPCHRVVRKDGGLSGYRWGIERKATLLAREAGA